MKEQEPLESLLESATRLVYATHNLSGDLKIYWSNFLLSYSSTSLSNTQIHQREIRAAANSFRDQGEILAFFKNIHPTDQIWILAALILLITEAEKQSDWVSHRNIEDLSKLLRQALSSSGENGISDRHRELETAYSIHQNRKLILVRGSILLVTCDYVLRWLILAVFNVNDYDKDFLWPINLGIPLVIFLLAYLISRNNRRHNQQLIENILPKWNYRMQHSMTSTQYTILGVYLGSSVFIVSLLIPDNADFFSLLLFLGMTLYYYGLIGSFPIGRLSEGQILQQTKSEPEPDLADADQNDETIVQIETELNANTGRLEAYVLESALFGALSFSGFLQIISTDAVSFRDLSDFSANVFSASHGFIYADWSEFYRYAGLLNNKINLLCLVSIETLICSVFFLAVIASRLHLVWIAAVCGKLKTDFRYSNTLGWNTFPVPTLTEKNKSDLTACTEAILLAREAHFPATIADLYDPEKMPENLRAAHDRNDEVLERIYIGRRFKNDTERLEKLFEMYTKMTTKKGKVTV